jgi:hypothetical protein
VSSGQLSHPVALSPENLPAVHARHRLDAPAPEYVPGSHAKHSTARSSEYSPAPHAEHATVENCPVNVPAAHGMHDSPASSALYWPGAQGPHTETCRTHKSQSQGNIHPPRMLPSPYHLVGPPYPKAYHNIVSCVQAAFQRRLNRIDIELAEAQHVVDCLDLADPDRRLALAMASNPDLGQQSPLLSLPEDLLRSIALQASAV